MMPLGIINGSTYLKKDNSLRKWSKCVKITRYVEQILGKKSTGFQHTPCVKRANGGGGDTRGCSPLQHGSKGRSLSPSLQDLCGFCMGINCVNLRVWVIANSYTPAVYFVWACSGLPPLHAHTICTPLYWVQIEGAMPLSGHSLRDERWFSGWSQSWPRIVFRWNPGAQVANRIR